MSKLPEDPPMSVDGNEERGIFLLINHIMLSYCRVIVELIKNILIIFQKIYKVQGQITSKVKFKHYSFDRKVI